MGPFDTFRNQLQHHRRKIRQTEPSVSYAQALLSNEWDIGPRLCAHIAQSMRSVEEPLQAFYKLLNTPELVPPDIKAFRHPLLIALDSATRLLADVIFNLKSLPTISYTASSYETRAYQQHIVRQLETLEEKRHDIEHNIDRLLLKTKTHN